MVGEHNNPDDNLKVRKKNSLSLEIVDMFRSHVYQPHLYIRR
jgi:hypothetical protein